MVQFSYSFCMAMLHSFWQAALLLLLYITVDNLIHKNNAPLAKRNFLYAAITVQVALFVLTFCLYFFDAQAIGVMATFIQQIAAVAGENNLALITPWIFSFYIFIIAYKLIHAGYSWVRFKKNYKTGLQKPTVDLKLFTELTGIRFGIKRKVKLWLSSSVQTPVTFGFFKPIILLPVALVNHISTEQAETLILHELTHIRTHDYLLNWLLIFAETIFFFNPLVIKLCRKIRLEREKHCDINVVSFAYSPVLYAETLLQAERMKQLVPVFQLAAVNRKKHLLERIQFFTNEKIIDRPLRFNFIVPLIGLILLALLSTAIIFRSGNPGYPLQSSVELAALPFGNYRFSETEYWKQIKTDNLKSTETGETGSAAINPIIVKPVKTNSKPKDVSNPKPKLDQQVLVPVEFSIPVAIKENDAARQIIIKEEGSGSASVKVYYLSFENDKWMLRPEWMLTAREIQTDSLLIKTDSSLKNKFIKVYPAQQ